MTSNDLINAQFDRAVEIVQGLPKTGPIQTDYEEKLTMYSLYKQATVGNVKAPRPGIWDMLGRAKWDAWAKHKDLDSAEAKWLYVDALLKVLRKYSDKTMARSLVEELESYGGDPYNIVASRTSADSDSSGSSDDGRAPPPFIRNTNSQSSQNISRPQGPEYPEEESDDEARDLAPVQLHFDPSQTRRPQSSLSSHRYRTPMAGSLIVPSTPPPPVPAPASVPHTQPMPGFETPSAFAEPSTISVPSSLYPTGSSYVGHFSQSSRAELVSPQNVYPQHLAYPSGSSQSPPQPLRPFGPTIRPTLEHAVELLQAQVAALTERLETIESYSRYPSRSRMSMSANSTSWVGRGSPTGRDDYDWDLEDLGMWSILVAPISNGIEYLRNMARFLARDETRSPSSIIIRRLCLDASFLFCVLGIIRVLWRRSGARRKEVSAALVVLWRAILGTKPPRTFIDRGV